MQYHHILYEKKGRIARVTINRPEVLNALHQPANAEMLDAFTNFRDDPDVLVAIVTGAGDRAFCAGDDLKYQTEHGKPGEPYPGFEKFPLGGITRDFTCWKPIIGAVNGLALGGGMELALACDILIAAEHAKFGLPEPRVGVVAGAGGPFRLPRQVPHKIAMGMLLTGRHITAQEAYRLGLVNELAPADKLMQTAESWAKEILDGAPLSAAASKQMALQGLDMPLEQGLNAEFSEYRKAMASEDYVEGPQAFVEKRRPRWKGA